MRNLVWVIIAAAIVMGGYMLATGRTLTDIATGTPQEQPASPQTDAVDEAATPTQTVEETAQEVEDTAENVVDAVTQAGEDAVEAAEQAVDEAAQAITDTAQDAVDTATQAVEDAAAVADDAATGVTETVTETVEQVATDLEQLLTVDGFDFDQVKEVIEGSDLSNTQKMLLTQAVQAAQDSPELLDAALQQLREALNL